MGGGLALLTSKIPKVLLLRAWDDSVKTAHLLKEKGYIPAIEPLLSVIQTPPVTLPSGDAYIFTSQNAVRALDPLWSCIKSRVVKPRLYAVGHKTGEMIEKMSGLCVLTAKGEGRSLLALIQKTSTQKERLLYFCGDLLAFDLVGDLRRRGFNAFSYAVYKSIYRDHLSSPVVKALERKDFFAVFFYSPESAQRFRDLIHGHGLEHYLDTTYALVLSPSIGKALGSLKWRAILCSSEKSSESLCHLLDQLVTQTVGESS